MNTSGASSLGKGDYIPDPIQPDFFNLAMYLLENVVNSQVGKNMTFYYQRIFFFGFDERKKILNSQINKIYDELLGFMGNRYLSNLINRCLTWQNFPNEESNIVIHADEERTQGSFMEYLDELIYENIIHQNVGIPVIKRPHNFNVFLKKGIDELLEYDFMGKEQVFDTIFDDDNNEIGEFRDFIDKKIELPVDIIKVSILLKNLRQLLILKETSDGRSFTLSSILNKEQAFAIYNKIIDLELIENTTTAKNIFSHILTGTFNSRSGTIQIKNRKKDHIVFLFGLFYAQGYFTNNNWIDDLIKAKIFIDHKKNTLNKKPFESWNTNLDDKLKELDINKKKKYTKSQEAYFNLFKLFHSNFGTQEYSPPKEIRVYSQVNYKN